MTIHKSEGSRASLCAHTLRRLGVEPFVKHPLDTDGAIHTVFRRYQTADTEAYRRGTISPLCDKSLSPVADIIDQDRQAEIIDNLNATYVAFTRASRELIIHTNTKNIGKYIHDLMSVPGSATDLTVDLSQGYDSLTETYTLGQPPPSLKRKRNPRADKSEAGEYSIIYRSDTRELVSIDDALAMDLDIGDEEDKEIVDSVKPFEGTPEMREAARRGTNMHAILATMRTVGDLQKSLAWQCAREDVPDGEAAEYHTILSEAISAGGDTVAESGSTPVARYMPSARYTYPMPTNRSVPTAWWYVPTALWSLLTTKFTRGIRESHRVQVSHYVELLHKLRKALGRRLYLVSGTQTNNKSIKLALE